VSNVVFQWPLFMVPAPSVVYCHVVVVVGFVSLMVTLNMPLVVSFAEMFMRKFVDCTVLLVMPVIAAVGLVLSMVIERFCVMFVPCWVVVFALRL